MAKFEQFIILKYPKNGEIFLILSREQGWENSFELHFFECSTTLKFAEFSSWIVHHGWKKIQIFMFWNTKEWLNHEWSSTSAHRSRSSAPAHIFVEELAALSYYLSYFGVRRCTDLDTSCTGWISCLHRINRYFTAWIPHWKSFLIKWFLMNRTYMKRHFDLRSRNLFLTFQRVTCSPRYFLRFWVL